MLKKYNNRIQTDCYTALLRRSVPAAADARRYTAPAVEIVACKMSLLLRRKGGLFSKDYELLDKDSVVCFMQFDDWRHASLLIEGQRYSVRANGRGRWVLEESGNSVAGSQRQGTCPRLA